MRNRSLRPRIGSFFGLLNLEVWRLIRRGQFDAVVVYTGYAYATFWLALSCAKITRIPIIFGTDATSFLPRDKKSWKLPVKRRLLPWIFRRADGVIIPSEAGRNFILNMGISASRVSLTPFVVDNAWWQKRASEVDRRAVRESWKIPEEALVVIFCAKLQPWKRPDDALRAFARADVRDAYLVFAGDGPMRASLEAQAQSLGVAHRVRFLGFLNQTALPSAYRSADLFVLTSEYDPCPAVVCEAMLCGCPVILSDHARGRFDLVRDGDTGFIFPCGDINRLAAIFTEMFNDRARLGELRRRSLARMETWTPRDNVNALVRAVQKVTD
ncbi:MAG TPA: glycosyltransferase [Terriglobales bacterium]|nr:glycosyltransferase [Terriglobales bacterium]